jgi:predicted DCC family thiol-disulfide oxidoreductase YuxK
MDHARPYSSNPILLYDGVCGLCNRLVQFVLKRDRQDRFCFAALQSDFARKILARHGANPGDLDTFYLVLDCGQPGERLSARSDATVGVLRDLGGIWGGFGSVVRMFPKWFRDRSYNRVARSRYRIFGKYDACPLPEEKHRHKFLDA